MATSYTYVITTGAAGGWTITLTLFPRDNGGVIGSGTITQAVNPPIEIDMGIIGAWTGPAAGPVSVTLVGSALPATTPLFHCVLSLPNGWGQDGTATGSFVYDGVTHSFSNQSARYVTSQS